MMYKTARAAYRVLLCFFKRRRGDLIFGMVEYRILCYSNENKMLLHAQYWDTECDSDNYMNREGIKCEDTRYVPENDQTVK